MEANRTDQLIDLAIQIQQIPAPTFSEGRRAAFIAEQFRGEGLCEVSIDPVGNVYGCLKGRGRAAPLVLSAHLDTVFPESTDLKVKRTAERIAAPGIGDNSLGVAGLFALLWALRERHPHLSAGSSDFPGDLWLVGNVGEEGLGDLRGMRAVVERFGSAPRGYLVLEGMALGQVYHRALGVRRYRIHVRTPGGHSWVDYGRPSAVHELARLVHRLADLPLPKRPRTSLNVGVIAGGTTVNTIAAEAHIELDLRSEGAEPLADLTDRVESLVLEANRPDVEVSAQVIGERPAGKISNNHPLVQAARRALEEHGFHPNLGIGSTDANIPLSRGYPAVCVGLTTGGGAHTLAEYVDTRPLALGVRQLVRLVENAFQLS